MAISDAVVEREIFMTGEDLPELEIEQTIVPSQADRLEAFGGAAVDINYGDAEDEVAAYTSNLNLSSEQKDAKAGKALVDGVISTLEGDGNPEQAGDIAVAAYNDSIKTGISDELGFETLAPEPEVLHQKKRVLTALDKINKELNGFLDVAGEYAKAVFIPFRDRLAAKSVFDTFDLGKVENFVNTYKAQEPEKQAQLLNVLFENLESTEGYWVEKAGYINLLISDTADEDIQLTRLFAALDVAGAMGDVATVAKLGSMMRKKMDIAAVLKSSGNEGLGGRVLADAIANPKAAEATGTNVSKAVADIATGAPHAPVDVTLANLGTGGTHATGVHQAFRKAVDEDLTKVKQKLLPEVFNKEEMAKELDKVTTEAVDTLLKSGKVDTQTQPRVSYKTVSSDGLIELEISYDPQRVLTKSGEVDKRFKAKPPEMITISHTVQSDAWQNLGEFARRDVLLGGLNPASPKFKLEGVQGKGTTVGRSVEDAGLVANAQPAFEEVFAGAFTMARKQAGNKKSQARVNELLAARDAKAGKDPLTKDDLIKIKPDVTQKELDSYLMYDELLDVANTVKGDIKFRRSQLLGVKEVKLSQKSLGFGRVFESTGTKFRNALDDSWLSCVKVNNFYDNSTGRTIAATDVDTVLKAENKKIVVLDKDEVMPDGNKHRAVVVHADDVTDLRRTSLDIHRVDNYVPRIRQNAKYFVTEMVEDVVNGEKVTRRQTFAAADSKQDQMRIKEERRAQVEAGGEKVAGVVKDSQKTHYDREGMGPGFGDDSPLDTGGLFVGHRAEHPIVWEGYAKELDRPDMAIAKNLAYLARNMPMNEWRMGIDSRWRNSAREAGIDKPNLHNPLPTSSEDLRLLEEERRYLASVLGIPDTETQAWEGFTKALSEVIDTKMGRSTSVSRAIRRGGVKDPIATLKYLAFQSLLGWFNPAQLLVQAFNMTVVMSMHPKTTAKTMHKSMALRAVLHTEDEAVVRALATRAGMDADEMVDIHRQFLNGGYTQVQTNADIDAAAQGYGSTRRVFQKAADAGLMLYRQGELTGRSVVYPTARQLFMDERGIRNWKQLTDQDHREIRELFDNLSLNLGKENKANFQRGIVSPATQFWHVQTKFLEMFLGKKFTPKDRVKLILGQGALFGAAGIPLGSKLAEVWQKQFTDPEDGSSTSIVDHELVRQGLISFIAGDADLASRGGIPNALTDQILSVFEETNTPMWEKLMGASGTLFGRVGYAANIFSSFVPGNVDLVQEDALIRILKASAGLTSSFNNAEQAFMMYKTNRFMSKTNGRINFDNPTTGEIWSKAFGFQSQRERDLFLASKNVTDREKYHVKLADKFFQIQFNYGVDIHKEEFSERFKEDFITWTQLHSAGDHDAEALQKAIWKRIWDSKSKEVQTFAKVLKQQMSERISPEWVDKGREVLN